LDYLETKSPSNLVAFGAILAKMTMIAAAVRNVVTYRLHGIITGKHVDKPAHNTTPAIGDSSEV
jgi:hypothetical protein